jgi:hypothetical protein
VSIRTIIEINHDYIYDLHNAGHIGKTLDILLGSSGNVEILNRSPNLPQGIKVLGQRHHSETLKLEVK